MSFIRKYWFACLSAAVFLSGVVFALTGIATFRGKMQRMTRSSSLMEMMTRLEHKAGSVERAVKALETMEKKVPDDLGLIVRNSGLSDKLGETMDSVTRINENWSLLAKEISFNDVVLEDVDRFILECRRSRPPWVVNKISVRSSPFESGRGQVSLTMHALRGKTD